MRRPVALAVVAAALCAGVAGHSDKMGSGEMFDAIAPRYDLINTFLSLGMHKWWRARMVAALDLQPGAGPVHRAALPAALPAQPSCSHRAAITRLLRAVTPVSARSRCCEWCRRPRAGLGHWNG